MGHCAFCANDFSALISLPNSSTNDMAFLASFLSSFVLETTGRPDNIESTIDVSRHESDANSKEAHSKI